MNRAWFAMALVIVLAAASAAPAPVRAQANTVAELLGAATAAVRRGDAQGAKALLERALEPERQASDGQRVQVLLLYGVAELLAGREAQARLSFRNALAVDPVALPGELAGLHADVRRVFASEQAALLAIEPDVVTVRPLRGLPLRTPSVTAWLSVFGDGSAVYVDGRPVGESPIVGLLLEAGWHVVRAWRNDSVVATAIPGAPIVVRRWRADTVLLYRDTEHLLGEPPHLWTAGRALGDPRADSLYANGAWTRAVAALRAEIDADDPGRSRRERAAQAYRAGLVYLAMARGRRGCGWEVDSARAMFRRSDSLSRRWRPPAGQVGAETERFVRSSRAGSGDYRMRSLGCV